MKKSQHLTPQRCFPNATRVSLSLLLLALATGPSLAHTVIWSEGFETYNTDAGQTYGGLDKNKIGSPNAAASGTHANPWFGPAPNNGWVTKEMTNPDPIQETVTPHSGQFMMRGNRSAAGWYTAADLDIDYVNLAYQFNQGASFTNLISIDWWFYDLLGNRYPGDVNKGPGCFGDHAGLCYVPAAQTTTDYDENNPGDPANQPSGGTPTLPVNGGMTARLAIGAFEESGTVGAYDVGVYQVQVLGAADGQFSGGRYADGWFNTTMPRTNGWRHAAITIDRNNRAVFSIDDVVLLVHDTLAPNGFNLFNTTELQATPDTYNQSAYYDDISLSRITGPAITSTAVSGTNLVITATGGLVGWTYTVAAATDPSQPRNSWTDLSSSVLSATGPFQLVVTNAFSANTPRRFFNIRAGIAAP